MLEDTRCRPRPLTSTLAVLFVATFVSPPRSEPATGCAVRWKTDCNPALPRYGCQMGCDSPLPLAPAQGRFFASAGIRQSGAPCALGGGSFNLAGTQYVSVCPTPPDCLPPLRFWDFDNWGGVLGGNGGCVLAGASAPWIEYMSSDRWQVRAIPTDGPALDGCSTARNVVEISDLDPATAGTVNHSSWFVIASVEWTSAQWDLSRAAGGLAAGGCTDADLVATPVSAVTLPGRSAACTGTGTETPVRANRLDPTWGDVDVTIVDPSPLWFTEMGASAPPALVAGFQLMYAGGNEPTSSDPVAGGWRPARDPGDPARALGVVPVGTANVTVSVPRGSGPQWLALRLVYSAGAAMNPLNGFDPALEPGPRVVSFLGGHCGPVAAPAPCNVAALDRPLELKGARTGAGARFEWLADPAAAEYHLNSVSRKIDLVDPGPHLPDRPGGLGQLECSVMAGRLTCTDPDAMVAGPELYYRVLSACAANGASEGPSD